MMKKIAGIVALIALASGTAYAGMAARTGINGSFHDLTYYSTLNGKTYLADDYKRVCVFCHTPHNADTTSGGGVPQPLWNHVVSDMSKITTPYTWQAPANAGINFALGNDQLVGPSRLCMGCHDGTTAADGHGPTGIGTAQGNVVGANHPIDPASGRAFPDLSGTHPIGFLWTDAEGARNKPAVGGMAAINEIVPTTATFLAAVPSDDTTVDTVTRAGWTYTQKPISDVLYGGYMTCASCHEVHNKENAVNEAGLRSGVTPNYFLWAPEKNSAICLSCHIK